MKNAYGKLKRKYGFIPAVVLFGMFTKNISVTPNHIKFVLIGR